jgi:hypothetical protein
MRTPMYRNISQLLIDGRRISTLPMLPAQLDSRVAVETIFLLYDLRNNSGSCCGM